MMQKNDLLTLECLSLGANMEGVCRANGMAVFVPGMLPGETAPVRLVKVQSRFAYGILAGAVDSPSAARVRPDCPAFPRCGGCSCRHMNYGATLQWKQKHVQDCFHSIAHLDVDVLPTLGMDEPLHFRNKSSYPIGGTAENPFLGFFAPRSHRIIPVDSCPNSMLPADAICHAFLAWMRSHRISPYDEETQTGLLRHLVIRINQDHHAMVTLVATHRDVPHLDALVDALKPLSVDTVVLNENRKNTNVILGEHYHTIFGSGVLCDRILGVTFEISSASFFQVNVPQAEKLYEKAIAFAHLTPQDRVLDLYCGAGTISLCMARHCQEVIGIEVVPQAIENAQRNCERNSIRNSQFHAGKAEDILPRLVRKGLKPDVIVVDPPRKGLDPIVIQSMIQVAPQRLVYVSCNPATLARDIRFFVDAGYDIQAIQPVDMFGYASDVETVVELTLARTA